MEVSESRNRLQDAEALGTESIPMAASSQPSSRTGTSPNNTVSGSNASHTDTKGAAKNSGLDEGYDILVTLAIPFILAYFVVLGLRVSAGANDQSQTANQIALLAFCSDNQNVSYYISSPRFSQLIGLGK